VHLLVVRHAEAAPARAGGCDADRALTPDGERRFARSAQGLARITPPPTTLLTSPLLRARQTAAIAASAWGGIVPVPEPALADGTVDTILAVLATQPHDGMVVLIGHEPTVSALVAELVGARASALSFGVGAAALLDVESPAHRTGRLVWFLPAATTERLGDG
jgi:phosphohistidine phosphatase